MVLSGINESEFWNQKCLVQDILLVVGVKYLCQHGQVKYMMLSHKYSTCSTLSDSGWLLWDSPGCCQILLQPVPDMSTTGQSTHQTAIPANCHKGNTPKRNSKCWL
jgi:hypothetical protein